MPGQIGDQEHIEQALQDHRPFFSSIRINAFFHDLDKVFADFLRWSLAGGAKTVGDYLGHSPKKKETAGQSWPIREKYAITWKAFFQPNIHQGDEITFPVPAIYLSYLDQAGNHYHLSGASRSGNSWYDFAIYHHDRSDFLIENAPAALLLFTAGTAGVDGLDTQYETESKYHTHKNKNERYRGHHVPETLDYNKVLIATPFGYEREVDIDAAEKHVSDISYKLQKISDCMDRAEEIIKSLQPSFQKTIIRTGRPINDITLADHSVSAAALAVAQAARLVLETAVRPEDQAIQYCLPARNIPDPNEVPCQQTGFAVFSCAVNAGFLDTMALELKDITAIREEVQDLFDVFVQTFTNEYPVGGEVYRDQHGVHVIIPLLGDPSRRWVKNNSWYHDDAQGIQPTKFVNWLLRKAHQALADNPVHLGRELLIGCRYTPISQQLNQLAGAIDWTREISFLSAAADSHDQATGTKAVFFRLCPPDHRQIQDDLCGVCGLRQGNRRRKHRKCLVCEERVRKHRVSDEEIGDIDELAHYSADHRMALFSISFDLSGWLAEETNSGIFSFQINTSDLRKQRITEYQRYNSFGRFRRIWRTTEIFLQEIRDAIWKECRDSGDQRSRMRTILLQPQDMQIILPADLARKALDLAYAKFSTEFGRVNGRVPFHVSLCIFPFRVPIYLVLDAARRLRESCLRKNPQETQVSRLQDNLLCRYEIRTGHQEFGPFGRKKSYTHYMPLIWSQELQPNNCLKGNDYFHANVRVMSKETGQLQWKFAGDLSKDALETALMVDNRLAIVEIGSGFSLEELSVGSEHLPPSRCHDIPLDYWPRLKKFLALESCIPQNQRRKLRSIIAHREKLWRRHDLPGADDSEKSRFMRESVETLWRDPSRLGARGWKQLTETERDLLVESCLNGALFLASMVEKRLPEKQDRGTIT